MTDQIPSSVRGLLCELRPNLALAQMIKAADQLYFKDKRLYGQDVKPELLGATDSGKGKQQQKEEPGAAVAHGNEQHGQGQGKKKRKGKKQQQQQKEEVLEPKEQQQKQQQNANATGGTGKKQSKLQQMIGQVQQTVQHALQQNSGGNGGGYGVGEADEGELAALRAENAQLRARLEHCENRLRELELQHQ